MRLEFDEHERDLARALRAKLAGTDPDDVHGCLAELDVYAIETSLDLGLGMSVIVCEELGRHAARDDYRERTGGDRVGDWVRQAAYLLGLAAGAHRLAVYRASRRRQFGQAIADQQAIAFPLAAQFAQLEAVRLLVHRAAWLADEGEDAERAAARALAYAAEQALEITAWAVHVHGAYGLTRHASVHRYYERSVQEATRYGDPARLWQIAGP
jgi:hypothetical protein